MKKLAVVTAIVVGIATSVWLRGRSVHSQNPRLAIERTSLDLGLISRMPANRPEFSITNMGDRDLELAVEWTSCRCTEVEIEPAVLPPGSPGRIMFSIDKKSIIGAHAATAVIKTSDPERGQVHLRVSWEGVPAVSITPTALELNSSGTDHRQKEVTVSLAPDRDSSIAYMERIDSKPRLMVVEPIEPEATTWPKRFRIAAEQDSLNGERTPTVVAFAIRCPERVIVELPIYERRRDLDVIQPSKLFLGVVSAGARTQRQCEITANDVKPDDLRVSTIGRRIDVESTAVSVGTTLTVNLRFLVKQGNKFESDHLVFSCGKGELARMPLSWYVQN
jgi:hypothetical protein